MASVPLPIDPALAALGIGLRREAPEDDAFLRALYCEIRAVEFAHLALPEQARQRLLDDQFRLQHRHFTTTRPNADRLIVTRRGEMIGRLYLDRSGACWRLMEISLIASERCAGIGSALIKALMAGAAKAKTGAGAGIDLHVAIDNHPADALYRRLGFVTAAANEAAASHRRLVWQPVS